MCLHVYGIEIEPVAPRNGLFNVKFQRLLTFLDLIRGGLAVLEKFTEQENRRIINEGLIWVRKKR